MKIETYVCDICKKEIDKSLLMDYDSFQFVFCHQGVDFRIEVSYRHIKAPSYTEHVCLNCYKQAYNSYILDQTKNIRDRSLKCDQ